VGEREGGILIQSDNKNIANVINNNTK